MDLLIFGHRGYAARRVENTISAFELAAETAGVAGVELDVQVARDGEIVVVHDGDLRRLADDPRRVVDVPSTELATMALHAPGLRQTSPTGADPTADPTANPTGTELTTVGIPTLNTVLDTLPAWMKVDIELKSYDDTPRDLPERVAELIADRGRAGVIVSSFDPRLVRRFRRAIRRQPAAPEPVSTAVIYSQDREVPWFLRSGLGVALTRSEVAKPSWHTVLSGTSTGRPHRPAGRPRASQYVWTVNEQDILRRLMEADVAGVIGDDPGELAAWATAIAERSGEPGDGRRPEMRSE
ncbi:MAG: glycerophosphodiester phosphodiesterase [Alkalispirochaeta sp.]